MPVATGSLLLDDEALEVERKQAVDEGRDLSTVQDTIEDLGSQLETGPRDHQPEAQSLLDRIQQLPERSDYSYDEPATLDAIRAASPDDAPEVGPDDGDVDGLDVEAHVRGGWRGRCSGCLLGKPLEGLAGDEVWGLLEATRNDPLDTHLRGDIPADVWDRYGLDGQPEGRLTFVDEIDHMPRDDDIDYTIAGLSILTAHGLTFESEDVARHWLHHLPALNTYTAECIAYRNILNLIDPPESARHRNPFREGIGAQIRADAYGYVAVGDPALAAGFAWRDARISHVKNGVYGAMWVAAMVAAAPTLDDRDGVVRAGLGEIPATCRLAAAVEDVRGWFTAGVSDDDAVRRVHERWDDGHPYGWHHTIPNAMIVTIGLLWSETFGEAITRAVQAGFDTDCNGATVGSIVGMMGGAGSISASWTDPLNDTVETALVGRSSESITTLARETATLVRDEW